MGSMDRDERVPEVRVPSGTRGCATQRGATEKVAFQTEPGGSIVALGARWSALTGFGVEGCLGTSLLDYVHPDDRAVLSELFERLVRQEEIDGLASRVRCITKTNDVRPVDIWAQRVLGSRGDDGKIVGALTDSTGVRQTEFEHARLAAAVEQGAAWTGGLVTRAGDDKSRLQEASVSPVRDASGRIANYVGVLRDVTDERQTEAERQQAQKMEAMGLLAGGIAHDFNNVLTVVSGRCQLLRRRVASDATLVGEVDLIIAATQRATALTRQLLIFGRKQAMVPRVLDVGEVVLGLEKTLRRLIGEDVELIITAGFGQSHVRADTGQLEQALTNLVVNAREAMPTGGRLTISVANVQLPEAAGRVHPDVRPGPSVALSVTDTGCGIAREVVPRIFEPFFSTKAAKGTGLGLATVYGVVSAAGGCVEVESELGRGTTFRILFPRVDEETSAAGRPPEPAGSSDSETLLLAEDEEDVRALEVEILRRGGYTVLEASDGLAALEVARRHGGPVHLLITDVIMPRMGGVELAQKLLLERPDVELLFVSGYTADHLTDHGVLRKPYAFLQKPYTAAALLQKTREVLGATHRSTRSSP